MPYADLTHLRWRGNDGVTMVYSEDCTDPPFPDLPNWAPSTSRA
ncbi:hypothetical protein [Streptomyces sp. NBC_00271]|nr:hypothetical protein [Streptomyces sp. NBC_00271]